MTLEFLKRWITSLRGDARHVACKIQVREEGFEVACPQEPIQYCTFAEVGAVIGYKQDHFAYDVVCLEISRTGPVPRPVIIVSEEMHGFEDLVNRFERMLPGFDANWRAKVVPGPFQTNACTIFVRSPHE